MSILHFVITKEGFVEDENERRYGFYELVTLLNELCDKYDVEAK